MSRLVIPRGWGLVRDDASAGPLGAPAPRITVSYLWQSFFRPKLISMGRKQSTLDQYQSHVNAWVAWSMEQARQAAPADSHSKSCFECLEPKITEITREMLEAFQASMLKSGRAKVTAENRIEAIRAILREGARRRLLDEVPQFHSQANSDDRIAEEIVLPYDHIDAIYRACSVASWPEYSVDHKGVQRYLSAPPSDYWRFMIVWLFTFGMRAQDLVSWESRKTGLTWDQITLGPDSPNSANRNRYGWFHFVPQKTRWHTSRPLVLPLSEFARLHLDAIRPAELVPQLPIIPFPRNKRQFIAQRQAIMDAAGVRPKSLLDPNNRGYMLKHFRATCATWYDYHARGSSPASAMLGHATGRDGVARVTARHYVRHQKKIIRAVRTLPQPESFAAIRNRTQGLLFEV